MVTGDGDAAQPHAAGLAATRSRRLVLAALRDRHVPASANDIHDALRTMSLPISLTTVYRVLHLFAQTGLAHLFADDEHRYRLCTAAPHAHLICQRCRAVSEEPAETVRRWLRPANDRGFEVDVEHMSVPGVCGPCRAQRSRRWSASTHADDEYRPPQLHAVPVPAAMPVRA